VKSPYAWVAAFVAWLLVSSAWYRPLIDPDLWWLLWAGEQLLDGQLPRTNGLSYTAPDFPWVTHEAVVAWAYGLVGLKGIPILRGLVVSTTGLLLVRLAMRPKNGWAAVLALLWVGPLAAIGVSERALAWGDLLLACELSLLIGPPSRRRTLAAIGVVWLWAQVHGSFVLGIAILALFRGGWAIPAALLTLANPNGLALWGLVIGYGTGEGTRGLVHQFVEEWGWLTPSDLPQVARIACLAFAGLLVWTGKAWRPRLLWLGVTALAVRHWRYCDPAGIALLPFVARRLADLLPKRPVGRPDLLLGASLGVTALLSPPVHPDPESFPPEVPSLISSEHRVWSDFTLGGWLGWSGHPVFWDSRNDCYPVAVIEDGLRVAYQLENWQAVLRNWQIDVVLTQDEDLSLALQEAGWIRQQTSALFLLESPTTGSGGANQNPEGALDGTQKPAPEDG
jgi:hypothetical protein